MGFAEFEADVKVALKRYHPSEQFFRFLRLIIFGLLSSGVVDQFVGGTLTRQGFVLALVAALEVAFRQVVPAVTVGQATDGVAGLVGRLLGASPEVPPSGPSTPPVSPPSPGAPR